MGKVRPEHVKKMARELIELYPDKFSTNFQNNKKAITSVAQFYSAKLRNRTAGYITRLLSIERAAEEAEAEAEIEEGAMEEGEVESEESAEEEKE